MAEKKIQEQIDPVQEFVMAYQEIVEKYGFKITAVPAWQLRDDGTYSMVVRMQAVKVDQGGM